MTARAEMERATWNALTKHRQAIADGTWQRAADNTLVDNILKAADVYALGAAAARRRGQITARQLDEALAKVMADA